MGDFSPMEKSPIFNILDRPAPNCTLCDYTYGASRRKNEGTSTSDFSAFAGASVTRGAAGAVGAEGLPAESSLDVNRLIKLLNPNRCAGC
jgi:hypothetical protein